MWQPELLNCSNSGNKYITKFIVVLDVLMRRWQCHTM
jgi:hypothetical protein